MEHNLIEAVYYINMDRSVDRRRSIETVLKDKVFDSMKKYRIKGVDGKQKDILPYLHSQLKNIKINKKYTTKVYGCLLSHLHALLEFSKSNHDIALIAEDDLSLDYKKYWQEDLNTCIRNAPSDWGIIQLAYLCKIPKKLYAPWDNNSCAAAYVVNKKSVLAFLKNHYINNQFVLDQNSKHFVSDYYLFKYMKTYVYKYAFFTYEAKDSFIHPSHLNKSHRPCKKIIEDMLKKRKTKKNKKNYHKS